MVSTSTTDAVVNDFLANLGLGIRELTPEQMFVDEINAGKVTKLAMMRHYLNHEMSKFQSLLESGFAVTRNAVEGGTVIKKPIKNEDYARFSIEYYLQMNYLTRFQRGIVGFEPLKMNTVLDMLLALSELKEIIHKKF